MQAETEFKQKSSAAAFMRAMMTSYIAAYIHITYTWWYRQ